MKSLQYVNLCMSYFHNKFTATAGKTFKITVKCTVNCVKNCALNLLWILAFRKISFIVLYLRILHQFKIRNKCSLGKLKVLLKKILRGAASKEWPKNVKKKTFIFAFELVLLASQLAYTYIIVGTSWLQFFPILDHFARFHKSFKQ